MSLVSELQAFNIDFQRQTTHDAQGEGGTVTFEQINNDTGEIEDFFTCSVFEYTDRDFRGNRLPPDAHFEMRIPEAELSPSDIIGCGSLRHQTAHGTLRFTLLRGTELWPTGLDRVWRCQMATIEILPQGVGTVLRFSETTYAQINEDEDALQIAA